ncbi:MAG: hypothetical protein RL021_1321 [Bacteroidota bacterium]|jgi:hypothetical protein
MKKALLLFCFLTIVHAVSRAQSIQLPAPEWKITAKRYHLKAVIDNRKQQQDIGEHIRGSQRNPITFTSGLEEELLQHLAGGLTQDKQHTAGLECQIERLQLRDVESGSRHTITLDMKIRMSREIEGVKQTLFETESRPSYQSTAPENQELYIRLITKTLADFMRQFNDWAVAHPEQPWFMNQVVVRFAPRSKPFKGDDTLLWSPERKLLWSDFKGKAPQPTPYSAQSNCIYALATLQGFAADTMILTSVLSPCFTRKASWVESGAEQDQLLSHEQLHFDLCELYARKFRQKLSTAVLSILQFDKEIQSLFSENWSAYRSAQDRYDAETQHGTIAEKQTEWQAQVAKELSELDAFRTP